MTIIYLMIKMSKYLNTIMQKEYKNIKIIGLLNNANCERNDKIY